MLSKLLGHVSTSTPFVCRHVYVAPYRVLELTAALLTITDAPRLESDLAEFAAGRP